MDSQLNFKTKIWILSLHKQLHFFTIFCHLQICTVKKRNGIKNHHHVFWTPHGIDYLTKSCCTINNKNHSGEQYRGSIKLSRFTDCVVSQCPIASQKLPTPLHLHIALRKRQHKLLFSCLCILGCWLFSSLTKPRRNTFHMWALCSSRNKRSKGSRQKLFAIQF